MGRERQLIRSQEGKYFQEDYHSGLRGNEELEGFDFAKGFVTWIGISAHR